MTCEHSIRLLADIKPLVGRREGRGLHGCTSDDAHVRRCIVGGGNVLHRRRCDQYMDSSERRWPS